MLQKACAAPLGCCNALVTRPSTTEQAVEAGMPDGIAGYAVGRLGVLGDCPVDNVVAAAFFWDQTFLQSKS